MDLVKSVWKATLIKRAAEICFSFLQMLVVSSNFASVGFQFYQAGNYVHWTLTNTENKNKLNINSRRHSRKLPVKDEGYVVRQDCQQVNYVHQLPYKLDLKQLVFS